MTLDLTQKDVSNEPPTPLGSFDTSSTCNFRRKADLAGAARGVTRSRSLGTSLAKPRSEDSDAPGVVPGATEPQDGGSTQNRQSVEYAAALASCEASCLIMRGDLALAIRDLQRCRSLTWISEELRSQLGRCLYELTLARRMCP